MPFCIRRASIGTWRSPRLEPVTPLVPNTLCRRFCEERADLLILQSRGSFYAFFPLSAGNLAFCLRKSIAWYDVSCSVGNLLPTANYLLPCIGYRAYVLASRERDMGSREVTSARA